MLLEKNASVVVREFDKIEIYRRLFQVIWEREKIDGPQLAGLTSTSPADGNLLFRYVTGCGLARPLLAALKRDNLCWLQPSFVEPLHSQATQDAVDDLLKREALTRIAGVLRAIGRRGILLKGTALQILRTRSCALPLQRRTGDIDIYVESPFGADLRRGLLQSGFEGLADEARTAPHHLASVRFRGVAVEIHERIMPSFWGLPEREMIADAVPVDDLDPLHRLSAEGLMLHAGIHASAHFFTHGLKTAWDLVWIARRFRDLDWKRLTTWIQTCRVQRAFWVPVRVLTQDLSLPIPAAFLQNAPADEREMKLERIARDRLFSCMEGPFDLNPLSKTWVFLLLHDSLMERVGYLAALRKGTAAKARQTARHNDPSFGLRQGWRQMREAFTQWRHYQSL
jgi:hypothetical protein